MLKRLFSNILGGQDFVTGLLREAMQDRTKKSCVVRLGAFVGLKIQDMIRESGDRGTSIFNFLMCRSHSVQFTPLVAETTAAWEPHSAAFLKRVARQSRRLFVKEFVPFGGERGCKGYAPGACWVLLSFG